MPKSADIVPIAGNDSETSSEVIAEAVRFARRTRYSPISGLSAQSLTRSLDGFERGDLREASIMWAAMASRDDTIPGVKAKREKSVAHKRLETVGLEKSAEADAHREVLEAFWRNARYVSAWDRNDAGGVQKLIRRMQESVSYQYSAHHIVWQPTRDGLRATFEHVPLWFFEAREARLRFLPSGYGLEGAELDPREWLISYGDGLMFASSIGYFLKRASLQDWLRFSEKFAMPGTLGKTSALKDSPEGRSMRDAVASFGQEWAAVIYGDDGSGRSGIELIQANGNPAAMPMPALIERVDRKIAALYRGADLSTMSSSNPDGTGASLQAEEQDILERADAADRSEELRSVERTVIEWQFGAGTEPLAQTRLMVPEREDQKLLLDATKIFVGMGARIPVRDTLGRFGLSEAENDEAVLGAGDADTAANAAHDGWRFQGRNERGQFGTGKRGGIFPSANTQLETEGGFTMSLAGDPQTSGYAVAPAKETERVYDSATWGETDLDEYIDEHWDLLTRERAKLGGWIHEGKVYLDVAIVVDDYDEALRLATAGDQIAFFDLANGIEINTDEANEKRRTENADRGAARAIPLRRSAPRRGQRGVQSTHQERAEASGNPDAGRQSESEVAGSLEESANEIAVLLLESALAEFDETDDAPSPRESGEESDRQPSILSAPNAVSVSPEADGWYQIAPYGEWPTVDGRYVQVFGREQAEQVVRHFNSAAFRVTRWLSNREVPVFIGHPDIDRKSWPDERKLAVKHRRLEAREDGLWGQAEWNALGLENLANGYWQYPSPVWLFPKPDGLLGKARSLFGKPISNRVFPDLLQSVGLTNFQNTPDARRVTHNAADPGGTPTPPTDENDDIMNPELLAALGLDENATVEDAIALVTSLKQATNVAPEKVTALEGELAAANAARETAETALQAHREVAANAMLDVAIEGGTLTLGERKGWEARFATDYEAAANALAEIKPSSTAALNTKSVDLPGKSTAAPGTARDRIAAVNAAVAAEMQVNGGDYDLAHATVKADPKMLHIFEAMRPATADDDEG